MGRDLQQLVAATAVTDDGDLQAEVLFREAHEVGKARIECGFPATDEDDRLQSPFGHEP